MAENADGRDNDKNRSNDDPRTGSRRTGNPGTEEPTQAVAEDTDGGRGTSARGGRPETNESFEKLLEFIKEARGFDFTGYKRTSLARRVHKRMSEVAIADYVDYRDLLETNTDEFTSLFNTILINVTSFFRDAEAWRYLEREVVPEVLADMAPTDEIRVWSAGCSSGEEAYSLAIMFAEAIGIDECLSRVKIYGTDVDTDALHEARSGIYSVRALEPLSKDLREKYFEPVGPNFAFRPDLRRRVIFGRHDITRDAPISRLHLLGCRNTLMYFNVETQSQIIDRFDFALRDTGYLFLGKAEILLADSERFGTVNVRHRIFRRLAGSPATTQQPAKMRFEATPRAEVRETGSHRVLRDLAVELAPNPVIAVDLNGTVVVINNQARAVFGLTVNDVGRRFRDLEISYRPLELRSLIEQAQSELKTVRVNTVEMQVKDELHFFDVIVQPLWGNRMDVFGVTVGFVDTTLSTRLQRQLQQSREDLETAYEEQQSTNEELETTNEELQSSIEEFETTNEELQSTNEELETTNEELQSGNEELETMNEELRTRTSELEEARYFLEGVLSSVGAGLIVLDADLRVRSWNRGAEELWGLRNDEVHQQSFLRLDFGLPTSTLTEPLQNCLRTGERVGPLTIDGVNRKGRSIVCSVVCSPLNRTGEGVVLLMEARESPDGAPGLERT
jgi:two-component system, chemotaxis family, CheB/CheR fusion protein